MPRILIVEDDQQLRESIAEQLIFAGYEVEEAENGKAGIDKARQSMPDIILCDIQMPEVDGFAVLDTLRADTETAAIPFIFLTAFVQRAYMRYAMERGADDFLTKPFSQQELIAAIESRLRRRAYHENKLEEARQTFARMISHELRTPLTSLLFANDYLKRTMDKITPESMQDLADMIQGGSYRLQHLIDQFVLQFELESERLTAEEISAHAEIQDIQKQLDKAIMQARRFASRNRELGIEVEILGTPPILVRVLGNTLIHMLTELIMNALHFSPEDKPVKVRLLPSKSNVLIEVIDAGSGISKERLDFIFERFSQVDRAQNEQQGVGLGLWLTYQIALLYDGDVWVEKTDENGTTMALRLPLAKGVNGTPKPPVK